MITARHLEGGDGGPWTWPASGVDIDELEVLLNRRLLITVPRVPPLARPWPKFLFVDVGGTTWCWQPGSRATLWAAWLRLTTSWEVVYDDGTAVEVLETDEASALSALFHHLKYVVASAVIKRMVNVLRLSMPSLTEPLVAIAADSDLSERWPRCGHVRSAYGDFEKAVGGYDPEAMPEALWDMWGRIARAYEYWWANHPLGAEASLIQLTPVLDKWRRSVRE